MKTYKILYNRNGAAGEYISKCIKIILQNFTTA